MDQSGMGFVHDHRLTLGILADVITFLGGAVLSWDVFFGPRNLKTKRIVDAFRTTFPKLNLKDAELEEARKSVWRAVSGAGLLVVGLICQILLRFAD